MVVGLHPFDGALDAVRLVLSPHRDSQHPLGRSGGPKSGASRDAPWGEALSVVDDFSRSAGVKAGCNLLPEPDS
jgi:hypothetical protein